MRVKVRARNDELLQTALGLLKAAGASILLVNERRRFVATRDLSPSLEAKLKRTGLEVVSDEQYSSDRATPSAGTRRG
jgi:hypothetical protein